MDENNITPAKYKYSENELDNQLFREAIQNNPDEKVIRKLVSDGANINAVDKAGESVLINTISSIGEDLKINIIKIILKLGANINYASDGFNCLFDACLTKNIELVVLLLKSGANPNCISADSDESLLDWAEFDQFYEETEFEDKGGEQMAQIVELLKNYGAKPVSEIYTNNLEKRLIIFGSYITGLFTAKGNIKIEDIPNADTELINRFNNWIKSNPDTWNEYKYNELKITNPPDLNILKKHNDDGLHLAKKIKEIINPEIEVKFFYVDPEDLEKHWARNVNRMRIE